MMTVGVPVGATLSNCSFTYLAVRYQKRSVCMYFTLLTTRFVDVVCVFPIEDTRSYYLLIYIFAKCVDHNVFSNVLIFYHVEDRSKWQYGRSAWAYHAQRFYLHIVRSKPCKSGSPQVLVVFAQQTLSTKRHSTIQFNES